MKYALIALILATPAAADCLTAANLATGISFTRVDGRSGVAVEEGRNLHVNYAAGPGEWRDDRVSFFGVYDLQANFHFSNEVMVGGGYPHYTWSYAGEPLRPTPGESFHTKVKQSRSEYMGTEVEPPPVKSRYEATYSFLAPVEGKFGKCIYSAVPVEAAYSDGSTQRWLYFPALGLGLETRSRGMEGQPAKGLGLTALKAK